MGKFSVIYDFTSVKDEVGDNLGIPKLHVNEIVNLPTWNKVRIEGAEEVDGQYGKYLVVSYVSHPSREWVHNQAYFKLEELKHLGVALGLAAVSSSDQLVGRELFVRFHEKAGTGAKSDRTFCDVLSHSLTEPEGSSSADGSSDKLPF